MRAAAFSTLISLAILVAACSNGTSDAPEPTTAPPTVAQDTPERGEPTAAATEPTQSATATMPEPTSTPTTSLDEQGSNGSDSPFQSLRQLGVTGVGAIDSRSLTLPSLNSLFSCNDSAMGDALDRPWLDQSGTIFFADKPFVVGSVEWRSELEIVISSDSRSITGNGLPDHVTGVYPIDSGSEAYSYDRNPNSIGPGNVDYAIPSSPQVADEPTCLSLGPIGIALSGAVFFNALDADLRDAVANEIFDDCEGHPAPMGTYHYHHGSPCIDAGQEGDHSPLAGYALDGFGIYGPQGERGVVVTNDDLDECHGHLGPVLLPDGSSATAYHYHLNEEFPYTLGCYRGAVNIQGPASGPGGPGPGGRPPPPRR